jgi:hypothetical protein
VRVLWPLEPEGRGNEIEEAMLGVLRAMVPFFQAEHLQHREIKPRVKMRNELKREEEIRTNPRLG